MNTRSSVFAAPAMLAAALLLLAGCSGDGGGGSAVAVGAEPGDAALVVEGGSSEPASAGSGDGVGVGGEPGSAGDADAAGKADVPTGDGGPVRPRSLPVGGVAPNAPAAQEELLVDPVTGCYVDDFACIDRETARTSTTTTTTTGKPLPSTTRPPPTTAQPHDHVDPATDDNQDGQDCRWVSGSGLAEDADCDRKFRDGDPVTGLVSAEACAKVPPVRDRAAATDPLPHLGAPGSGLLRRTGAGRLPGILFGWGDNSPEWPNTSSNGEDGRAWNRAGRNWGTDVYDPQIALYARWMGDTMNVTLRGDSFRLDQPGRVVTDPADTASLDSDCVRPSCPDSDRDGDGDPTNDPPLPFDPDNLGPNPADHCVCVEAAKTNRIKYLQDGTVNWLGWELVSPGTANDWPIWQRIKDPGTDTGWAADDDGNPMCGRPH